jgi:hypothetical protein
MTACFSWSLFSPSRPSSFGIINGLIAARLLEELPAHKARVENA